jgi:voltage-gated potassium channel
VRPSASPERKLVRRLTTVGYGDIVPVGERARLVDALFVTPVRIFVWFIFLGTAYELVFQRIVEDLRMRTLRDSLKDHVIICGFGYAGRIAARELAVAEPPERAVVVELRPQRLEEAAAAGSTRCAAAWSSPSSARAA